MPEICFQTKVWRSGSAWVAQMTAQAIARQGATIAFVSPCAQPQSREPFHPNLQRVMTPRELVGEGNRVQRIIASLTRIVAHLSAIARLRWTTKTFIFSIPEPLLFTLPLFALLRISGARVIYIVHDAEPHAWAMGKALRRIERWGFKLAYRLASINVPLTSAAGDVLGKTFGVPARKIVVVPIGPFSIGDVPPLPGDLRLLLFGSLRRNKSVVEVIRGVVLARAQGLPVSLLLAGEPLKQEPGYWQACETAMMEDPAAFIVMMGFLPDEDLPGVVAGVDAFVLAYRDFHSQSAVAVLAALAGRPVIGTVSGGLDELFGRGMVGEIVSSPVTPESVAAAIQAFYARPAEEWRRRAAEGAINVASTLSWDSIANDFIDLARGIPLRANR